MENRMTIFARAHAVAIVLSMSATPSLAAQYGRHADGPVRVQAQGDALEELERKADELSETARRTVEEFIALIGPVFMRFSNLIEDLPAYQAPEILPNGDIIIRRKPDSPAPADKTEGGLTET